jgi:hypothetical protein
MGLSSSQQETYRSGGTFREENAFRRPIPQLCVHSRQQRAHGARPDPEQSRNFLVGETLGAEAQAIQFTGSEPGCDLLRGLSLLQQHFRIYLAVGHLVGALRGYLVLHGCPVQPVQQVIVEHTVQPRARILHSVAISAFREIPQKYLLYRIPARVPASRESLRIAQKTGGVLLVQPRNFLLQFAVRRTARTPRLRVWFHQLSCYAKPPKTQMLTLDNPRLISDPGQRDIFEYFQSSRKEIAGLSRLNYVGYAIEVKY